MNKPNGRWVTIARWLEDADGNRQPSTPEDIADFRRRWDAEVADALRKNVDGSKEEL